MIDQEWWKKVMGLCENNCPLFIIDNFIIVLVKIVVNGMVSKQLCYIYSILELSSGQKYLLSYLQK